MLREPTEIRPATPEDALAMYRLVRNAFEGYRAFLGSDWEPPPMILGVDGERARLEWPDTWARVAFDGDRLVAHIAFMDARTRVEPAEPIIGLAHLWQLFVEADWWGSGLATRLLRMAHEEMRARGYRAARLWTPKLHERARAFYEREGWRFSGTEVFDEDFGAELVDYQLQLR